MKLGLQIPCFTWPGVAIGPRLAEVAAESIPVLLRGTGRCNGIDPMGYRPCYAPRWALIQDVFNGDERCG
jgi:hypothetical protein